MSQTALSPRTVGARAKELYKNRLREQIETEDNIGKIVVIDVETGDYEIDADGLAASRRLRERHPDLDADSLYAIRIGYDAVFAIGSVLTRTAP